MTFTKRWERASNSKSTISGRIFIVLMIIWFIIKITTSAIALADGEIITVIMVTIIFSLCVIVSFMIIRLLLSFIISIAMWILSGEFEEIDSSMDKLDEFINTLFLLIFGDYEDKWDFLESIKK